MRMEADVAAVADPGTGMAVYTTLGANGWLVVGGTSAAAPLTAGALTNLGIADGQFSPAWIWQNPVNFYDITTGSNGPCNAGDPAYYCNAGAGYDGPTGWGTINGTLLATALPPGSPAGPACNLPTGSYAASCTTCVAQNRTTGCTLVCQECTKMDGTLNPGPTLGLPCDGSVENDDGALRCIGNPDAGSPADAGGTPDASTDTDGGSGVDGGAGHDAGDADASTTHDATTSDEGGGVTPVDASLSNDGAPASGNGANPFATTSGCACVSAPGQRSPAPMALVAGLVLVCLRRRPRPVVPIGR
jgi:MYXO-CTERM domain-containing protein